MFGDPACDGCGDPISALLVSVGVCLFCSVCFPAGVVVWPAHKAFAFDRGETAYRITVFSDHGGVSTAGSHFGGECVADPFPDSRSVPIRVFEDDGLGNEQLCVM